MEHELTAALAPTAALLGAQLAVGSAIDKVAVEPSALDNTTSDLLLRLHISATGSLRGVDLCRQLHLSPSYVSRRIDRAEAAGFVRREADPSDRRAQLISLTNDGRSAVEGLMPDLLGVVGDIVAVLNPGEAETLVDLLGRIERAAVNLVTTVTTAATSDAA